MSPVLVLLPALLSAAAAPAPGGRLTFVAKQLERATDPRLRAQAALLLGASHDPAAVKPLCGGLVDESPVVRSAAAKALEQLGEASGLECLKPRLGQETGDMKAAIDRAIKALEALAHRPPVKPALYISIAPIADKTSSLGTEILKLTEDRLKTKLASMGGMFAPAEESKADAKMVIKSKQLKGYYIKVELDRTAAGGLKLNLICFTYPDRSLLGEVNVKAQGGQPADLVRALAPKAVEEAAETFDWSS
jgi:hypothetical protein